MDEISLVRDRFLFLPLSLLTGSFGQSFAPLVNDVRRPTWSFFVRGVGTLVPSCAVPAGFFGRKGWSFGG